MSRVFVNENSDLVDFAAVLEVLLQVLRYCLEMYISYEN